MILIFLEKTVIAFRGSTDSRDKPARRFKSETFFTGVLNALVERMSYAVVDYKNIDKKVSLIAS